MLTIPFPHYKVLDVSYTYSRRDYIKTKGSYTLSDVYSHGQRATSGPWALGKGSSESPVMDEKSRDNGLAVLQSVRATAP